MWSNEEILNELRKFIKKIDFLFNGKRKAKKCGSHQRLFVYVCVYEKRNKNKEMMIKIGCNILQKIIPTYYPGCRVWNRIFCALYIIWFVSFTFLPQTFKHCVNNVSYFFNCMFFVISMFCLYLFVYIPIHPYTFRYFLCNTNHNTNYKIIWNDGHLEKGSWKQEQ